MMQIDGGTHTYDLPAQTAGTFILRLRYTDTPTTDPANADFDSDGIPNWLELNQYFTDPFDPDSDGDTLSDGDEVHIHHTDPSAGDTDGDGLDNFGEWLNNTDPQNPDSDGDDHNDGDEVAASSDPNKKESVPTDPNLPPADRNAPVPQYEDIVFRVGDPSGSHSERWRMDITGLGPDDLRSLGLASPAFGKNARRTIKLRKWNSYRITLTHLATSPAELRQRGPDYDWEATVGGLPATLSEEHTPLLTGVNNHFMLRKHWLVDNPAALLTTEKHGDETNLTTGRSATLVPVEIDDNQPASGVDDVSCIVPPGVKGRQEQHWIMAPSGPVPEDPSWGNTALFKTHLPSAPRLDFLVLGATADPDHLTLDTTNPEVVWKGASAETIDEIPNYLIGPAAAPIPLPVHVKVMKKRNVRVAVFPVKSLPGDPDIPLPSKTDPAVDINLILIGNVDFNPSFSNDRLIACFFDVFAADFDRFRRFPGVRNIGIR